MLNNKQLEPLPSISLRNRNEGGQGPLIKGDSREELVKTLHKMLLELGYDTRYDIDYSLEYGNEKYWYGEITEKMVKEFQESNRDWSGTPLTNGIVGPKTADALNRAMVGLYYPSYVTPDQFTVNFPVLTITRQELERAAASINPSPQSRHARIYIVPPPYRIKIRVTDSADRPITAIKYEIKIEDGGQILEGHTDSDGNILHEDIPNNRFSIKLLGLAC